MPSKFDSGAFIRLNSTAVRFRLIFVTNGMKFKSPKFGFYVFTRKENVLSILDGTTTTMRVIKGFFCYSRLGKKHAAVVDDR
jgi:hypothetical protein